MNYRAFTIRPILGILLSFSLNINQSEAADTPLNAVVASVNGRAITLKDVQKKGGLSAQPSLKDISGDTRLTKLVDQLILENILEDEAKERQISINEKDIERYISEIASQNNMDLAAFKTALEDEKISYTDYRNQVRAELLKGKIANSMFREGTAVSDQEINKYIEEHPELAQGGDKVKLRHLVINKEGKSSEEIDSLVEKIETALDAGDDFEDVVKEFSDSPDKSDGGLIGVLTISDLSAEIQEAIKSVDSDESSEKVDSAQMVQFFYVEERIGGDSKATVSDDVKKMLENEKMKSKLTQYFSADIFKKHSVQKKI
jgi:peptidyl-prolyl cis-trans isomerase SurA